MEKLLWPKCCDAANVDVASFTLNFRRVVLELIGCRWQTKHCKFLLWRRRPMPSSRRKTPGMLNDGLRVHLLPFWTVFPLSGTQGRSTKATNFTFRFESRNGHPKIENADFCCGWYPASNNNKNSMFASATFGAFKVGCGFVSQNVAVPNLHFWIFTQKSLPRFWIFTLLEFPQQQQRLSSSWQLPDAWCRRTLPYYTRGDGL